MDIQHYLYRIRTVRRDLVYVGIAGFVVGAAAGAVVSQVRLERKLDGMQGVEGPPGPPGPQGDPGPRGPAGDSLVRLKSFSDIDGIPLDEEQSIEVRVVDPPEEEPTAEDISSWADQELRKKRNEPYIISYDEFHNSDPSSQQMALEYFAVDDVLCDMSHVPIYNISQVVGELEFGRGSRDPDIVYVRNPKLDCDYEVTRRKEAYQVAILGAQVEEEAESEDLKHSDRVPRFRNE